MSTNMERRTRTLEEAFFRKRDAELLELMRQSERKEARRRALAQASGIANGKILDELVELDIHAEALAALVLVPLVEVAWADGHVHADEHAAVLVAVAASGIAKGSPAFGLVDHWLDKRPGPRLMAAWKGYVEALLPRLDPVARRGLRDIILTHARQVAEAAGGVLGLGRTSAGEKAILRELEGALE
jgi:hypothetical protein